MNKSTPMMSLLHGNSCSDLPLNVSYTKEFTPYTPRPIHSTDFSTQPSNSILNYLPSHIILEIFQYVHQYDLVNLLVLCKAISPLAIERLYRRVTVILNADIPVMYHNSSDYIRQNGIKFMDSSLIMTTQQLLGFLEVLGSHPHLIQKVKYFIFDKCHPNLANEVTDSFYHDRQAREDRCNEGQLSHIQNDIIKLFGTQATQLSFLHITFIDFISGIEKYSNFLSNSNVRNRIFKLFCLDLPSLYTPAIPQSLTNLFLMLDEMELMETDTIDLSSPQFQCFNSLFTLSCSTNNQLGLEILRKFRLNNDLKLNLKGLTIFHCHKEDLMMEDEFNFNHDAISLSDNLLLSDYINGLNKKLDFKVIESTIELAKLKNLYLKIDCNEHINNNCTCFPQFFKDMTECTTKNHGLPQLDSFELEVFPKFEWLRPHQLLENILTPLGTFIKSLSHLSRLTIAFSTPGFKMFHNSMGMTSLMLNRLNERLMEAFFLCFLSSTNYGTIKNLRTLQLPDFFTSFIYYKPNFYESLLHTCKCWGCQLVLDRLKEEFYPINDEYDDRDDEERLNDGMDLQSTYYIVIGFILGKLQADREVCVPIKQKTFNFSNYPIYKGQPHTLHSHFHKTRDCNCLQTDPSGKSPLNIDTLTTTYIIHQLAPIKDYLSMIFYKLDNLMIHGIYYQNVEGIMVPIFDNEEYPQELLQERAIEINEGLIPEVPFGQFRKT